MIEFITDLAMTIVETFDDLKKESKAKTIILTIGCIIIIALFILLIMSRY